MINDDAFLRDIHEKFIRSRCHFPYHFTLISYANG